jgi:cyclophilin family peptidyl-prolyl cis-trans isomerase/HEAT repeat protein
MIPATLRLPAFALAIAFSTAAAPHVQAPEMERLHAVLDADDRRGTEAALGVLRAGLRDDSARVRAAALRALGRLEQPRMLPEIESHANDPAPEVRAEVAHAMAQAGRGAAEASLLEPLATLLDDPAPPVRAAAAISLGRIGDSGNVGTVESLLGNALAADDAVVVDAAARGLEALTRRHSDHVVGDATAAALLNLATGAGQATTAGRVSATAALLHTGSLTGSVRARLAGDEEVEIRRLAVRAADGQDPALLESALTDPSDRVRIEAVRGLARSDGGGCERLFRVLDDAALAVRLAGIDAIAGCPDAATPLDALIKKTATNEWHERAHALVSLSQAAPDRARAALERAAADSVWQVRMYAARAAAQMAAIDWLRRFAGDEHANVQQAALAGLARHAGLAAADVYAAALRSTDYQVVLTAARALEGGDPRLLDAVLAALERLTSEQRETSRDPRQALLRTAGTLASAGDAARFARYLGDFDAEIARQASDLLRAWGQVTSPEPRPLPRLPFPSLAELERLARTPLVIELASGDSIRLRLLPWDAPTNAARFARLASEGYFDGLTFHRVAYNFVLQGGSPGANEYAGAAGYTRDEISARSHRRGTLGISTRGRNTGDAQIFINLVDNPRLDFDYTIFAEVTHGAAALDEVHEGAIINAVGGFDPR